MDAGTSGRTRGLAQRAEPSPDPLRTNERGSELPETGSFCATGPGESCRDTHTSFHTDSQWKGIGIDQIARRIEAAARTAVSVHIEGCVRDGISETDLANSQAASLLRLASQRHASGRAA